MFYPAVSTLSAGSFPKKKSLLRQNDNVLGGGGGGSIGEEKQKMQNKHTNGEPCGAIREGAALTKLCTIIAQRYVCTVVVVFFSFFSSVCVCAAQRRNIFSNVLRYSFWAGAFLFFLFPKTSVKFCRAPHTSRDSLLVIIRESKLVCVCGSPALACGRDDAFSYERAQGTNSRFLSQHGSVETSLGKAGTSRPEKVNRPHRPWVREFFFFFFFFFSSFFPSYPSFFLYFF